MRPMPFVIALTALGACAPSTPSTLSWRATLEARTTGVGLHRDGVTGHAGMFGTNCPFETMNGMVTGDQQLPGEGEEVQDVGTSTLGDDSVVLVLDETVYVLDKGTGVYAQSDFEAPGVREARLAQRQVVGLVDRGDDCAVTWFEDGAPTEQIAVDCVGGVGFDVHPETGLASVASADAVAFVSPDGIASGAEGGDLLSWDVDSGALYVATSGGSRVAALEMDGTTRWVAEVDGAITALTAAGTPGGAALTIERADGTGELVLLDAFAGTLDAVVPTPQAAVEVTASPDGSTIGLVRPEAVHFYVITR